MTPLESRCSPPPGWLVGRFGHSDSVGVAVSALPSGGPWVLIHVHVFVGSGTDGNGGGTRCARHALMHRVLCRVCSSEAVHQPAAHALAVAVHCVRTALRPPQPCARAIASPRTLTGFDPGGAAIAAKRFAGLVGFDGFDTVETHTTHAVVFLPPETGYQPYALPLSAGALREDDGEPQFFRADSPVIDPVTVTADVVLRSVFAGRAVVQLRVVRSLRAGPREEPKDHGDADAPRASLAAVRVLPDRRPRRQRPGRQRRQPRSPRPPHRTPTWPFSRRTT